LATPKSMRDSAEDVVFHALLGKYPVSEDALLRTYIRPQLDLWDSGSVDHQRDVRSLTDDIRNQILALRRVEEDWSRRPHADVGLEDFHRALLGSAEQVYRSTSFVEDFHGEPPTRLSDVAGSRRHIEGLLQKVDALRDAPLGAQAVFLADLVAHIIGTHVFSDGNGRVARLAAQYCLRRWAKPFVPIPKVRNAPRWKSVLRAGMDGDRGGLAAYIENLMLGKSVAEAEQLVTSGVTTDRREPSSE
jgi:hypothetical protein